MNKNIEVINDHLWAVKFSYIPYIEEIVYKPDPCKPAYTEYAMVTTEGLVILNKDRRGYNSLKAIFMNVMKKSDRQLKFEIEHTVEKKTDYQVTCAAARLFEIERRSIERGNQ